MRTRWAVRAVPVVGLIAQAVLLAVLAATAGLGEAGRHAYDVQMLVPQQFASRAFDVPDPGTPGGPLQMDDRAKERIPIHASGDRIHVDRIE